MKGIILIIALTVFLPPSIYANDSYKNISVKELKSIMEKKEPFVLVDVHIPEQKHIEGTDDFIPFNAIAQNREKLPSDKNTKILVYCRTGNMSREASQNLVDLGYVNVYNLEGGESEWRQAGFSINGPDKIIYLEAKRFSFSPDTIKVKMGEKIKIIARTIDVEHGFALPEFNVNSDIEPGKKEVIEFTADKKGAFHFICSVYCGPGHGAMRGTLIVE